MNLRIVPALLAGGLSLASCTSTPPLTIQTFTSPPEIVAVNSHLISGATDAILVDAQLFRADADQVVAMVKASGKKLTTIFITHAHPDHYAGLDVIATALRGKLTIDDLAHLELGQLEAIGQHRAARHLEAAPDLPRPRGARVDQHQTGLAGAFGGLMYRANLRYAGLPVVHVLPVTTYCAYARH